MKRKFLRFTMPLLFFLGLLGYSAIQSWAAPQDMVVGNGTPISCDSNTLSAALIEDGAITFNCGPNPHTIVADTYVINGAITIDGGDLVTLDGEDLRQIFLIQAGASLTLRNITLRNGFGSSGPGGAIENAGTLLIQQSTIADSGTDTVLAGGALANDATGTMTIEESIIENNSAADAAAIYTRGPALTLRNTTIRNNTVRQEGGGFYGGAIVQEANPDAVITISGSTFENNGSNPAGSYGGAISLISGQVVVDDSLFLGNTGYGGGGALYIKSGATATIRRSQLRNNRTAPGAGENYFPGGAIYNNGVLIVEESTLADNEATHGGAIFSDGEGSSFTLRRSTVSGNRTSGGGGGLFLFRGANLIENSTISGNTATSGGGVQSGITSGQGTATLTNVTLQDNSADTGAHLYVDDGSQPVTVQNTSFGLTRAGAACYAGVLLVSGGYNLEREESCGLTGATDQQNTDPLLGPLAANGGPTQTHLPQPGSPLLDAALGDCLATDQRGLARPIGATCDIGAVEREADAPIPTATPTATPTNTPFPITPVPTLVTNYAITALEVTQGIQDLQNSVPLVRGKPAWVRAHVRRAEGNYSPPVSAQLWRIVNGKYSGGPIYPSNPGGKIAPSSAPSRSQLYDSFYFPIPADWLNAANLQVEVEVNPQLINSCANPLICVFRWWREATETNYNDNTLRSPVLTLQSVPTMRLALYNVVYSKKTGNTTNWYKANNTQLFEIEDWVRRAYPIANLDSRRSETTLDEASIYRWVKDDKGNNLYQLQADLVNQRLGLVRNIDQTFNANFIKQMRYYGVVTDASGDFMRGLGGGYIASGPTGNAATSGWGWWDTDNSSYGDWYAGHEIGHTWNRGHPAEAGYVSETNKGCGHNRVDFNYPYSNAVIGGKNRLVPLGIGGNTQWLVIPPDRYYGFDIFLRGQVVYGPDWTDMMSYCDKQWISDYTYNAIRTQMQTEGLVQAAQVLGPAGEYAMIQGAFSDDLNTAILDTILHIPSPVGQPLPEPGAFAIQLRGANHTLLASYPFTPTVYADATDDHAYYINVAVPYPAGVQQIEVRKGDTLLATRTVSANAPSVQLHSPNGDETVGENGLTVIWSMSDADSDPLAATVLFSPDNGQRWQTLAVNITDTQVALSFAALPGTTQGRIRVLVTDGVNTTQAESAAVFTVNGHIPEAAILAPTANASFVVSQTVLLHGSGYDVEDGILPDTAFVWRSDRDSLLGTGAALPINTLTPGTHVITLQVTDASNNTATVKQTITIAEDVTAAPSVLTVAPQTLALTAIVGSSAQPTATLAIRDRNAGTGVTVPLAWSATTNAPWLTLAQTSGSVPSELQLAAATVNLSVGVYTTTVTVTANGNAQTVPVQLQVLPLEAILSGQSMLYLPLIRR